ncbi:MAG: crossover junction endodeoxyribonuclease RuvC [bacterium]|nr:crossover junction endodeoxyribonuclease RuvC [bacterium]
MAASTRRVLGIDPGLNITGYGVLDFAVGKVTLVEAGVIRGGSPKTMVSRLKKLYDGVTDIIGEFSPNEVAIEELYSHYERPRTAILMGHARGVFCLAAGNADLPVVPYAATQVKKVLTGSGRASKAQVQLAVCRELKLPHAPEPPDVADALAIALCHCYLGNREHV